MTGAPVRYSPAELAFIEARQAMRRRALHCVFVAAFDRHDVTVDHLKSLCTRRGWTTDRARWDAGDDALLRTLYPDTPTNDVAALLGRTLASTYRHATALGLCKSEEYLASPASCRLRRGDGVGAATRFQKGQVPANKGKPRPFNAHSAATQFKRGGLPANTKWAGHERVSKDGYVEISVNETNPHTGFERRYVHKHKWLWQQQHGPVPAGMVLKSIDGNKQHTDPSNWELVPRGLLPRLNGKSGRNYDRAPGELRPTIMAIAKLEHAAATRQRQGAS